MDPNNVPPPGASAPPPAASALPVLKPKETNALCEGAAASLANIAAMDTRRTWLFRVGLALNALAAAMIGIPIIGYVFSTLLNKNPHSSWITLGSVETFPEGDTRMAKFRNPFVKPWDGETADIPCWVRHIQGDKFQVFAINCTHLGCPVRWFNESRLFMCPCHGGVFYEDGSQASGPPPQALYQYRHKIENGKLMIYGGHMPNLGDPA